MKRSVILIRFLMMSKNTLESFVLLNQQIDLLRRLLYDLQVYTLMPRFDCPATLSLIQEGLKLQVYKHVSFVCYNKMYPLSFIHSKLNLQEICSELNNLTPSSLTSYLLNFFKQTFILHVQCILHKKYNTQLIQCSLRQITSPESGFFEKKNT